MTNQRVFYILLSAVLLLVIGAGIYFRYRMPIVGFAKLHIVPDGYMSGDNHNPLVYFAVYCLPDALWYMSLLLVQTLFMQEGGLLNRLLVGAAVCLPFLLEAGQYLGLVSGTFDWYDIFTYCFILILFLCLRKTSFLSPCK